MIKEIRRSILELIKPRATVTHPMEVWERKVEESETLAKDICEESEILTTPTLQMKPYERYERDAIKLKKNRAFQDPKLKKMLEDLELDFKKETDRLELLEASALDFLVWNGDNPFLTPNFNLNPFEEFGIRKATIKLKGTLFGYGKKQNQSFFVIEAKEFFDNSSLIFRRLNKNEKNDNLKAFMDCTKIQSHIIQAIPPEDSNLPIDEQTPNKDLVFLNDLDGYEKFWIPPTYKTKETGNHVTKILTLLSKYGYYVELDKSTEFDANNPENPQTSKDLNKHVCGYARNPLKKLNSYNNLSKKIKGSRAKLLWMQEKNDFVIERFQDLIDYPNQANK